MNSAGDMTAPCARRVLAVATFHMFALTEAARGRASRPDFRIATEWTVICSSTNMFSLHQLTECLIDISAATCWTFGGGVQALTCFSSLTSLASLGLALTA